MKHIIFNDKEYIVLDETKENYICEPIENEGYNYISKNKSIEIKEGSN